MIFCTSLGEGNSQINRINLTETCFSGLKKMKDKNQLEYNSLS